MRLSCSQPQLVNPLPYRLTIPIVALLQTGNAGKDAFSTHDIPQAIKPFGKRLFAAILGIDDNLFGYCFVCHGSFPVICLSAYYSTP